MDTFYYDMNDYLRTYYNMKLTKTSVFDDNNVSNLVKVIR